MDDDGGARPPTARVVEDPAAGATAYGDRAVAQGKRVADVTPRTPTPKKSAPKVKQPAYVTQAAALWGVVAGKDPVRSKVTIGDLVAHAARHAKSRPGVGRLGMFQAWTNSSTEVLVGPSLVRGVPRWGVVLLLRHEARHVEQFATAKDALPSYAQMIAFEATAYAETARLLRAENPTTAEEPYYDALEELLAKTVANFTARAAVTATEEQHREWMEQQKYLPPHPHGTANLYVR